MLRKRAPNPSFPGHRAHLFIFLAFRCPTQRVFRRTLVSCLRCAFQNRILHLKANDRFAFFWTTIRIFWTAVSLGLYLDRLRNRFLRAPCSCGIARLNVHPFSENPRWRARARAFVHGANSARAACACALVVAPVMAHRDGWLPRTGLVAIEGIADMNSRVASARSAEVDPDRT